MLEPHGGDLVKNIGDSFMVLFDSATEALRASMKLVTSTLSEELPLGFRASAATGDVEEMDGDYFGDAVNLSSRINKEVPGSQLWFANRTRLCMNQAELPWEAVGNYNFKGIPEPIPCFRVVPPGQCYLPDTVRAAIASEALLVLDSPDITIPRWLGAKHHVLVSGTSVDSRGLMAILGNLPSTLPAGHIWLRTEAIPAADRRLWLGRGHGLVVGTELAVKTAIENARPRSDSIGLHTIFFDEEEEEDSAFVAKIVGLALPTPPLVGVIDGYGFDLLPDHSWGFSRNSALARLDITAESTTLTPYQPGLMLDGAQLDPGKPSRLEGGELLEVPGGVHRYQSLTGPYRGIWIGPGGQGLSLLSNIPTEIGREPQGLGLELPSRGGFDRIRWSTGSRSAKARQRRVDVDRTQTGRRQTRLLVSGDTVQVDPIHERLSTYLYRDGELSKIRNPIHAGAGDLLIVGAYVIQIAGPDAS